MSQILKKFRLRRAIFTLVFLYKISFRGWNPKKKACGGPLSHQDYQLCHARSVPTLTFHDNMTWSGMTIHVRAGLAQLTGVDEFDQNASAAPYHTVTGFRQRKSSSMEPYLVFSLSLCSHRRGGMTKSTLGSQGLGPVMMSGVSGSAFVGDPVFFLRDERSGHVRSWRNFPLGEGEQGNAPGGGA